MAFAASPQPPHAIVVHWYHRRRTADAEAADRVLLAFALSMERTEAVR
jgi:hypothetical protein